MTAEKDKSVKLNTVELEESSLNRHIKVYLESYDSKMEELERDAKKLFDEMKNKDSMK